MMYASITPKTLAADITTAYNTYVEAFNNGSTMEDQNKLFQAYQTLNDLAQWNRDLQDTCSHTLATHDYLVVRDVAHEIIRMVDTGKSKEEIHEYLTSVMNTPYHGSHTQLAVSYAITLLHEFYPAMEEEIPA